MNLETINKWLDEEYGCSYTKLEELHDFYFEKYCALQQENKQLKMINKEYERLNKEKFRGFKIINVQEYNIDELLSYKKYKDNWNMLKEYISIKLYNTEYLQKLCGCRIDDIDHILLDAIRKEMQELERGVIDDNN